MSDHVKHHVASHDEDDPKARSTIVVGLLGATLVVVTILLLQALHSSTAQDEEYRKEIATPYVELQEVEASQRQQLESYRWVNQAEGVVAIPIEEAMQQVVDQHGNGARSSR